MHNNSCERRAHATRLRRYWLAYQWMLPRTSPCMLFAFLILEFTIVSLVDWLVGGHALHAMLNNFVANAYWTVILLFALGTKYNLLSVFHAPNFFRRLLLSDCPTQAAAVAVTRFQINLRNRQSCWSFFLPVFRVRSIRCGTKYALIYCTSRTAMSTEVVVLEPGPRRMHHGRNGIYTNNCYVAYANGISTILLDIDETRATTRVRARAGKPNLFPRSCRTEKVCLLLLCIHRQFRDSKYDCSLNWH